MRITVDPPSKDIFDILANPCRHQDHVGSLTICRTRSGPNGLQLGSKFSILNYRITNPVVEFRENEVIVWRHLDRWPWRCKLIALPKDETLATESFDTSCAPQMVVR
jgi:hypothetical protein